MKFLGNMENSIYADCEKCGHSIKIPKSLCVNKGKNNYSITQPIKCEKCGNESSEIIEVKEKRESFWKSMRKSFNEGMKKRDERIRQKASEPIHCPKCGSTQITAGKKGFSVGKAIVGDLVAGPEGLLAGNIGSNKVIVTCLKCGHTWKAGKGK